MTQRKHLSVYQQAMFWGAALLLFIGFVWVFGKVLLPFVLGMALAYFLDPVMRRLCAFGLPRWAAAISILSIFVIVITALMIAILPLAFKQAEQLITTLPAFIDKMTLQVAPYISWTQAHLGQDNVDSIRSAVKDNVGSALSFSGGVLAGLATGGQAIIGFITTLVITPIVAFFMMKEWPDIKKWFYNILPRDSEQTIRNLLSRIDRKLAGFIRGQLSVSFILAMIFSISLTIAGLNFGFLIGLLTGIFSIIPFVGSTLGLLISLVIAWLQSGSWTYVGIIAGIFAVVQFCEGNIISPRLLGKSVGIHPLWIFFSLLAGGHLFGFLGIVLAVPLIASIGVVVSYLITIYKASPYYKSVRSKDAIS